jgi:FeS assembly protein IscX
MPRLTWRDADEIGCQLHERMPDADPLSVRLTDLRRWVTELPDFGDDPSASNEGLLEAIQMSWMGYRTG